MPLGVRGPGRGIERHSLLAVCTHRPHATPAQRRVSFILVRRRRRERTVPRISAFHGDRDLHVPTRSPTPAPPYKLGTLNVSRASAFAVKNVKWTFRGKQGAHAFTKVTTSTVTGRFKSATTATGTITFTQRITKPCSGKVSFTATLGPARRTL
jgi:hypothetical protein